MTTLRLPSIRQAATETDIKTGLQVFTRPWFLFFMGVYQRVSAGTGSVVDDSNTLTGGQSVSTEAQLFALSDAVGQVPPSVQVTIDSITSEVSDLRALVTELIKEIESLKQGTML